MLKTTDFKKKVKKSTVTEMKTKTVKKNSTRILNLIAAHLIRLYIESSKVNDLSFSILYLNNEQNSNTF